MFLLGGRGQEPDDLRARPTCRTALPKRPAGPSPVAAGALRRKDVGGVAVVGAAGAAGDLRSQETFGCDYCI